MAYEAYCASADWTSVRGEPLPTWDGQEPWIRVHWRAAADAVADRVTGEPASEDREH